MAYPSCTFAEKFDFIWQTMIEDKDFIPKLINFVIDEISSFP